MTLVKTAGADEGSVYLLLHLLCCSWFVVYVFQWTSTRLALIHHACFLIEQEMWDNLPHKRTRAFPWTFSHSLMYENVLGFALSSWRHYSTHAGQHTRVLRHLPAGRVSGNISHPADPAQTLKACRAKDVRCKPSQSWRTEKDQLRKLSITSERDDGKRTQLSSDCEHDFPLKLHILVKPLFWSDVCSTDIGISLYSQHKLEKKEYSTLWQFVYCLNCLLQSG